MIKGKIEKGRENWECRDFKVKTGWNKATEILMLDSCAVVCVFVLK